MLRSLFLTFCCCLLALVQASSVPTAEEIALIRESWKSSVSQNQNVPIRALTELFKAHPRVQQLIPALANLPLQDLPKNTVFLRSAHLYYVFAMDFVVDCLDDEALLRDMLQRVDSYGKWYVDYVPKDQQIKESVKLYLKSLYAEEPSMSSETKQAWAKGLNYAFNLMGRDVASPSTGTSVLSREEIRILRQSYEKFSTSINILSKTLIKLLTQHPQAKRMAPTLENASAGDLNMNNPAFRDLVTDFGIITWFMVENVDNDELLTRALAKRTKPEYFVNYIEPEHQLDEFTRLFLEVAEEEKMCSIEQGVWKKVLDHANKIMTANAPKNIPHSREWNVPVLSGKIKGLIRDSWALARRNADLAPDSLLKFMHVHPETKQLFPRLVTVSRAELATNRGFLQASYNCFSGITWIVNNLDDMELVSKQIWKHSSPAWFTTQLPTNRDQLTEASLIFLEVLKEKLSDALTEEQVQAWKELFRTVNDVILGNVDDRPLTDDDQHVLRDTWGIAQRNPSFGANALLKFLKAHPYAQPYFPFFTTVPLSELPRNKDFIAMGDVIDKGIGSILANIEDPAWRNERFKGKDLKQYFAPNIPIHVQLQETTRVLLDTLDEELGPRFTTTTRDVWTRALRRFNDLLSEYVA